MRIGILTFHQSVNNGAVMQAYALSRRIQSEYPDATVEIIDYRMERVEQMYSYSLGSYLKSSSLRGTLAKCKRLLEDPQYLKRMRTRTRVFKSCLGKLPLSGERIVDNGTARLFAYIEKHYDVLVVGSDAVWNYISRGFPNAYLPEKSLSCVKMSYAASCYGMDFLQRADGERRQIKESLDDFAFIGVRDQATEDMVRWSGCKHPPIHTCDPTVFLDVDDLPIDVEALKKKLVQRGFDFSKPAIGMMGNRWMYELIRSLYGQKYQIVALYEHIKGADVNLFDLEPYEWAYVFRWFKLTFTTYFHGTLLSLRNGVPVVCIALETAFGKVHTPKTLDVLTRLGFSHWYFKKEQGKVDVEAIRKTADGFLTGDFRHEILAAMDREAGSFRSFNEALGKIESKKGKEHG